MSDLPQRQTRSKSLITLEIAKRIEENHQRAKQLREKHEVSRREQKAAKTASSTGAPTTSSTSQTGAVASTSRMKKSITALPDSNRDGTKQTPTGAPLRPAKNFAKYVEYNMSSLSDNKGGFLTIEDDPHNRAFQLKTRPGEDTFGKPANMSIQEWERLQLIRKLERQKAGPFEPGLSIMNEDTQRCRECDSREIDFVWEEVFKVCVCSPCKDKFPEKYSLLTKTECREDYLLTDEELKDTDILPHLNKPNPRKAHWHDMMLFLRFQVEEYAFNVKWGSPEKLDAEFEKREEEKKRRKEEKYKQRLLDLKRKTRTETFRRQASGAAGPTNFGDNLGGGKHIHSWGRSVVNKEGTEVKRCTECNMEVEEMTF